jgi:hypothetical protein
MLNYADAAQRQVMRRPRSMNYQRSEKGVAHR